VETLNKETGTPTSRFRNFEAMTSLFSNLTKSMNYLMNFFRIGQWQVLWRGDWWANK